MIWIIVSIITSIIYWLICKYFIYYDEGWHSFKVYHFILEVILSTIPILNIAVFIFIILILLFGILCDKLKLKKETDNYFIRFLNKEL